MFLMSLRKKTGGRRNRYVSEVFTAKNRRPQKTGMFSDGCRDVCPIFRMILRRLLFQDCIERMLKCFPVCHGLLVAGDLLCGISASGILENHADLIE